jgi:putative ABC transport system ATP-binding protein
MASPKQQIRDIEEVTNMLELTNIVKKYFIGEPNELTVLKGLTLRIQEGEFVSIVGQSGSGKSTLMNIMGALDRPTQGDYALDGMDVSGMDDKQLSHIRNERIGFVFQTFNLIARTTALSNVGVPLFYMGVPKKQREMKAKELLELVEMGDRLDHKPNELSGGQKQRVAIARALANDPSIILADEPTGALDTKTGELVMDIFKKINIEQKKTVILITHNEELARQTGRIITIRDGEIISDMPNKSFNVSEPSGSHTSSELNIPIPSEMRAAS